MRTVEEEKVEVVAGGTGDGRDAQIRASPGVGRR